MSHDAVVSRGFINQFHFHNYVLAQQLTRNLNLHLEILPLSDSVAFSLDYVELWLSVLFVRVNRILILSMKYVNQPIVTRRQ